MRRTPAIALASAAGLGALSVQVSASAAVRLSTELSQRQVEVGARFRVQLRAMTDSGDHVDSPDLKVPAGITATGPSVGSQSNISIVNGQMTQSVGITATWFLVASRPGTYKLGPASVQTSNGRSADRVVTVEVVAQGSLPAPPLAGGRQMDPFGMLQGLGGPGFPGFPGLPGMDEPEEERLPALPPEYRVDHAPDPIAFMRARALPRKVVIGQQVTLSVFAYGGRGAFQPGLVTEPSRGDFIAFNTIEDRQQTLMPMDIEGQRWATVKISEFALFPLKAGRLKAGEMSFGFVGRGYSNDPQGLTRKSQAAEIEVVEPPLNGRPPGYRLGDVGHYTLNAQVEPREVPAGGSISVVAKLEGTGNLPFTLLAPERDGVHFLEPQLVDQVGPRRSVVQGFRTFTYVVELSQPGEQDLGELTLPYWDPEARAYAVARAALGKVTVTGTAKPSTVTQPGAAATAHLKGLIAPPASLGELRAAQASFWPSRPGYWLLLLGLPLTAVLGFALADLTRLLGRRASARKGSIGAALDEALAQLARAARSADATASASSAERALFLGIERGTGLKARGVLKANLAGALANAGVAGDVAARAAELLARCDELRFAGEAVDLAGFASEVRQTCQLLGQRPSADKGAPSA